MKEVSVMSAAMSAFLLVPFLAVNRAGAEAAIGIAADVHLGFRAGEADVDVFYDALAPYGDWVDTGHYGLCWAPHGARHDWQPYRYGRWVYTDYGWTWIGDEEWAWGPYHYGRWVFDPAYGWIWVPGSVWAPAWVAWRWGDGYAGWAPLPPEADPSAGPADFGIDPLAFVFVEERFLAEPVLERHYVPPARNVTIINVTRNVTDYRVVGERVVNQGVPVDAVERVAGHAVPRLRVAEHSAPAPTRVRGAEVAMFRPPVPQAASRPRVATTRSLAAPQGAASPSPSELKRRQDEERKQWQANEGKERDELRRLHEQEKATPPPNVSPQQLEERHRAEERAQAQHEQREKQMLEERQARERRAAEEAAKQRPGQKASKEKDKKKPAKNEQPG